MTVQPKILLFVDHWGGSVLHDNYEGSKNTLDHAHHGHDV